MSNPAAVTLREAHARLPGLPTYKICTGCQSPIPEQEKRWFWCVECSKRCLGCGAEMTKETRVDNPLGTPECLTCYWADIRSRCGDCGDYTDRCKCCVAFGINWANKGPGKYCGLCGGQFHDGVRNVVNCSCE